MFLLGNGVDLRRFDPGAVDDETATAVRAELGAQGEGDVVVGLVARLVREKGYREVFEAARRLRDTHPEVRVAAIGPVETDKSDALTAGELDDAGGAGVRILGLRDDLAWPPSRRARLASIASSWCGTPQEMMVWH